VKTYCTICQNMSVYGNLQQLNQGTFMRIMVVALLVCITALTAFAQTSQPSGPGPTNQPARGRGVGRRGGAAGARGARGGARGPTTRYSYPLLSDSLPKEGVPKGKLEGTILFHSQVYPNTIREYWVYVPAQYDPEKAAAVLVFQDGHRAINPKGVLRVPQVMENLIASKEMPVTIGIFITPGQNLRDGDDPNIMPDPFSLPGQNPTNRSNEYDALGPAYANFVINEILPEVGKKYNLTKDPEGRAIGGTSSGAICAFTVAWERPDQFRKVFSGIGSFTAIKGGDAYAGMVASTDKKPIRVFLQDGENDNRNPNILARDWHYQNMAMVNALQTKGYDMGYVFGHGIHADDHGGQVLPDAMRWLWRDYPGVEYKGDGTYHDHTNEVAILPTTVPSAGQ
jgi:enterochelin esterase family protein